MRLGIKVSIMLTCVSLLFQCGGGGGSVGIQPLNPLPPAQPVLSPSGDAVFVQAGPFWMGSRPDEGYADERPIHKVTLDAFWIDRTEVTVGAYRACVDSSACSEPLTTPASCNWNQPGREEHPVNCVDWQQAAAYCLWAGKRLPTEAEWEKAGRGTDGRQFPWGKEEANCSYCVMKAGAEGDEGCGDGSTLPVGSKPAGASPYGAEDMAGNVFEWVEDWYDSEYYAGGPASNPGGPSTGLARGLRGGSWGNDNPWYLTVSNRSARDPSDRSAYFGFRCARADD